MHELKKKIFNNGFTLIELLVVVMTMTLIFTVGFANYRDFQRRKILETAVETLKADLRFAQQQALSSNKPGGCAATESLDSYIFRRISATTYEVVARCVPGPNDVVVKQASETDISTKHPDISINPFSDIMFRILGRGVNADVTITLTQLSSGATDTIEVTKGGEIK